LYVNKREEKCILRIVRHWQCRIGAGNVTASLEKKSWTKLIRFGQIWLDLDKIGAKFGQN